MPDRRGPWTRAAPRPARLGAVTHRPRTTTRQARALPVRPGRPTRRRRPPSAAGVDAGAAGKRLTERLDGAACAAEAGAATTGPVFRQAPPGAYGQTRQGTARLTRLGRARRRSPAPRAGAAETARYRAPRAARRRPAGRSPDR